MRKLYPNFDFDTPDQVFAEYESRDISSETGATIHQHIFGLLVAKDGKILLLREALNMAQVSKALNSPKDQREKKRGLFVLGCTNATSLGRSPEERLQQTRNCQLRTGSPSGGISCCPNLLGFVAPYLPRWLSMRFARLMHDNQSSPSDCG